ncbi:MAG TPA: NAD(P)H-quinone oxidoreductase [Thermoanaerobaculia bacterium]|jgi:putative PIG3 family NAD(P)H quinone oxidoreductase|nr:NAD(P)H-quinone oxidoreductase [Thermoanaerobaculia bacterium]
MRAAIVEGKEFRIADIDRPTPGPNELRIRVHTTAVNRADLLQREGHYPPPPGASEIIGLECAGVVIDAGENVRGWSKGDRAMALLAGGGYAEEVVVDAGSAMHVPDALTDEEAAAIPEVFLTAFSNIFMLARAKQGESILIHGGGSGVGTAATTLCKLNDMRVIVTAGSDEKCAQCLRHGADAAINYRTEDFVEKAKEVDIVLDHIGAKYLARDLDTLAMEGRVVIIGSMGGERTATIDVSRLLSKRLQILGSTLRARRVEEKAAIVKTFIDRFGPALSDGRIKPVIDRVYELHDVDEAHRRVAGDHFGKVVIRVSR